MLVSNVPDSTQQQMLFMNTHECTNKCKIISNHTYEENTVGLLGMILSTWFLEYIDLRSSFEVIDYHCNEIFSPQKFPTTINLLDGMDYT